MTALIVVASIIAYLVVGGLCGRYTVPAGMRRSYNYWQSRYPMSAHKDSARLAGQGWRIITLIGWVIAVPVTAVLNDDWLSVEKYAPWAQQEKAATLQQRIDELEHELNIKDSHGLRRTARMASQRIRPRIPRHGPGNPRRN